MKLRTPAFAVEDPMPERTQVEEIAITVQRFRKAARLADALEKAGAKADQIRWLNEASWVAAEAIAACNSASAITRSLVAEILRDRERR